MDPTLEELQRQRAAVQQHLDWLDAQIAVRRSAATPAPQSAAPASQVAPSSPSENPEAATVSALVADYQAEAARSPARLKQGCWLLFAVVLTGCACAVALGWYWMRRA